MPRRRASSPSEWVRIAEAVSMVGKLEKRPERVAEILIQALADGSLLARADQIRTEDTDGSEERRNHIVPPHIWSQGPIPPLGHMFWIAGDIRVVPPPVPPGSRVWIEGHPIDAPFGALLPIYTVRGLRVSRAGLFALCRSLGGDPGRGRRPGTGSLAAADEPFLLEMEELIDIGAAPSVYAAACRVGIRAAGPGTVESRIKRLARRYKARFPER